MGKSRRAVCHPHSIRDVSGAEAPCHPSASAGRAVRGVPTDAEARGDKQPRMGNSGSINATRTDRPPDDCSNCDAEGPATAYCVVEEGRCLHTWFRVQPTNPTAPALCPYLLKLLRLKLLLCPLFDELYDNEATHLLNLRFWPAHGPAANNSYQIVSRTGPRVLSASHYTMTKTCIGSPSVPTATVTDALSGETCLVSWIEDDSHADICPMSLATWGWSSAQCAPGLGEPLRGWSY